uniref:TPR_REGION domain-containing protein n=1 Tax=Angiostrongylus cantonensis TaxID=6313 RepID=A0A0K0D6X9_ANGCA
LPLGLEGVRLFETNLASISRLRKHEKFGELDAMSNQHRARDVLRTLQFHHPSAESYGDYGAILHINGKFDEAKRLYEKSLLLDPSNNVVKSNLRTSTEEGIGISFAIIEKLLKQKVHFSTFFYHFPPQVVYVNGQEQFCPTHRLHKGAYNGPLYGFELVELSTFPREVIESARTLAHRLHKESSDKRFL